jgi:hypothetical protein
MQTLGPTRAPFVGTYLTADMNERLGAAPVTSFQDLAGAAQASVWP